MLDFVRDQNFKVSICPDKILKCFLFNVLAITAFSIKLEHGKKPVLINLTLFFDRVSFMNAPNRGYVSCLAFDFFLYIVL